MFSDFRKPWGSAAAIRHDAAALSMHQCTSSPAHSAHTVPASSVHLCATLEFWGGKPRPITDTDKEM